MTLSYTFPPTYPVPPAGRVAATVREGHLRGTFVTFGGVR
jgi:hypothetical protein